MSVKLLTEDNLRFLSLKGGCTGSSQSKLVKMPHCWKSRVRAYYVIILLTIPRQPFLVYPFCVSCHTVLSVPCGHLLGKS